MNIVFLGSSKFAVPSLVRIVSSSHKVICVVTQPDKPAGRGMKLIQTPVKQKGLEFNLPLYQTENVNANEPLKFLNSLGPDLLCVVAFGQILSEEVLRIPKTLCLNIHASLLPEYRGASPIRRAIINGETQTGVTVIKVVKQLDAGPIILQREVKIEDYDDAFSLEERLADLGSDLIRQSLDLIQMDKHSLVVQDENKATFALKLKKTDGLIRWNKSARDIFNLVRGCVGWPGAFIYHGGKILKIHKVSLPFSECLPAGSSAGIQGEILGISKKGIIVSTGQGNLLIEELQVEGKKKTAAFEFVSGYKISVGEVLGEKK